MTSLKIQYANEIMESMAKSLGDDEFLGVFKKASLSKEAGNVLNAFTNAVSAVKGDAAKVESLWNQYLPELQKEENAIPGTIDAAVKVREEAKGGPGTTVPAAEDEECEAKDDIETETCSLCGREVLAADFALNHLVKVADALDKHGFNVLANIIDSAMEKIAKKKDKEEDEEEDKKKEKKDKKKEKEDKKKKDEKKSK